MSWRRVCAAGVLLVAGLLHLASGSAAMAAGWTGAEGGQTDLTLRVADVKTTISGSTSEFRRVLLPYHWDDVNGPTDGSATLLLNFALDDLTQPLALYLPRLGNQFSISLNGKFLAGDGGLTAHGFQDTSSRPYYFPLPASELSATNLLRIELQVLGGRYGGLSKVHVGDASVLRTRHGLRYFLEISGRRALVALTAVLGLLGFLFWWRQREVEYLYYGLSELFWTILTSRSWLDYSDWPAPLATLVFFIPLNLAPPLLWKFVLKVYGAGGGMLDRMVDALLVLAIPAALVAAYLHGNWFIQLWQGLLVASTLGVTLRVVSGLRTRSPWEKKVLGTALLIIVFCAMRDYLSYRFSADAYEVVSWTRYAWGGIGLSFAWLIAERLRNSTRSLARLNDALSTELAARNAELQAAFERERQSVLARGAADERLRLMRDLHDGLGSHLQGAMHFAQLPGAANEEVVEQLAQAMDQLRMTVDAMQETDGDIPSLLGAVRYRLNRRLQAAGIELNWRVDALPLVEGWSVTQSHQLQMIIFEAFANLIRHSHATRAGLTAISEVRDGLHWIEIEIVDNGLGWQPQALPGSAGKGLDGMRARAASLHGKFEITSRPGRSCVLLAIPLRSMAGPAPGEVFHDPLAPSSSQGAGAP